MSFGKQIAFFGAAFVGVFTGAIAMNALLYKLRGPAKYDQNYHRQQYPNNKYKQSYSRNQQPADNIDSLKNKRIFD